MRIPLPNGSQVFVSSAVDAVTLDPPAVDAVGWVPIQKVTDGISASGGTERWAQHTPLGSYLDTRRPNGRDPIDMQISYQEAPGSAHHQLIAAGKAARAPLGWRIKFPNGAQILFSGYASGTLLPVMNRNNLMTVTVSIAVIGEPQRISG